MREGKASTRRLRKHLWNEHQSVWGHVRKHVQPWPEFSCCARLLPLGCPQDRFGKGCEHKCACRNGGLCHATNGSCSCPLGWMGPHCEHGECEGWLVPEKEAEFGGLGGCVGVVSQGATKNPFARPCTACPAGRYGAACLLECSCQNNGSCEPTSGACLCGPGFYGQACEDSEWGCPLPMCMLSRLVLAHEDSGHPLRHCSWGEMGWPVSEAGRVCSGSHRTGGDGLPC